MSESKLTTESRILQLSVTQLASFACRQGDLIPDAVAGPSAQEGIRAHKRLQDQRKHSAGQPDWLYSEVRVNCQCDVDDQRVHLNGRIDLVDSRRPLLSEIKTTLVPAEQLPEAQRALQWAQLYLYGHMYLRQKPRFAKSVELELIHVNIRSNTVSCDTRTLSTIELNTHAQNALQCYVRWYLKIQDWRQRMISTATALPFPFERFRQGQRDMAAAIYRASRDANALLCEAPTGIGKTVSSLYPSIKAMGEGHLHQLVYLTAKVAGRLSAEQALQKLGIAGLEATTIQLSAKESICFCSIGRCERDTDGRCPMTLGFFDRLPDARDELLAKGMIDSATLTAVAWEHQLCPSELTQQLLPWVQIVIADYNYVFDPLSRLNHFSQPSTNTVLLIDEAHNLVDRARSMYSAQLNRQNCMDAAHECRLTFPVLASMLDKLVRQLLALMPSLENDAAITVVSQEPPPKLARSVSLILEHLAEAIAERGLIGDATSDLWRALSRYTVICDLFSDRHRCITRYTRKGRKRQVEVTLYCVDASVALAKIYRLFKAPLMFSATLRPGTFYRNALGLDEDTGYLQLPNPFDASRCLRCVVDWVDTRYRQRQGSMALLVNLISATTAPYEGNYLVFFPSYAYLEQAHALFVDTYPNQHTWKQSRGQSKRDQKALLDQLDIAGHRVGFAIQGGVFGEGIDYVGQRLIGTLIVGTGLPAMDEQSELIAEHYKQSGHDGYDFTYRYPGFTRVLQTAGRVIRNESDKGFVLLVDARFKQAGYQRLFPDDWKVAYPASEEELVGSLQGFWKQSEN